MPLKNNKTSADAQIREALRCHIRVRHAFQSYDGVLKALETEKERDITTYLLSKPHERSDLKQKSLIVTIGEVYEEVTRRSPRTIGTGNNKNGIAEGEHASADLIIELFKEKGFDPPSVYAIRKALKKRAR
jgi:hypothetical protein